MSGYLLPFITCVRELTLFMLLCSQTKIITTMLDYFDEMGLYAFFQQAQPDSDRVHPDLQRAD